MAVYEPRLRSLAEYLSSLTLGFIPSDVESSIGYRENDSGSRYAISAYRIMCDKIHVNSDAFLDADGNLVVISYLPGFRYRLCTNELPPSYQEGKHLSFGYRTKSSTLRLEIGKDTPVDGYDDFEQCRENLIRQIGKALEASILAFEREKEEWRIRDLDCRISWEVDRIRKA